MYIKISDPIIHICCLPASTTKSGYVSLSVRFFKRDALRLEILKEYPPIVRAIRVFNIIDNLPCFQANLEKSRECICGHM